MLNFDYGLEGPLVETYGSKIAGIKSFGSRLGVGHLPSKSEAADVWADISNTFMTALRAKARSVIVDTFSDAWEWARIAHFGKLDKVLPHHYVEVNDIVRRLVLECHRFDSNVVFIHKSKEEYKNDKPTGKMVRDGMRHMGYAVHSNITHSRDLVDGVNVFKLTVTDARQNMSLCGVEFVDEQVDFPYFGEMVFPNSTEADWK